VAPFLRVLATLPGVLTGITAFVAAVTGFLTTTHVFDDGGGADPATVGCASSGPVTFETGSGSVTIACPPHNKVQHCWLYRGDARLHPGRTLVVATRRVYPPATATDFEGAQWNGGVGQSTWYAYRFFGEQPGQIYRVFVVVIARKALDDILRAHKTVREVWRDSKLPRVGADVVRLDPDVTQVPGEGNCRV
jgi:hypothetical protein